LSGVRKRKRYRLLRPKVTQRHRYAVELAAVLLKQALTHKLCPARVGKKCILNLVFSGGTYQATKCRWGDPLECRVLIGLYRCSRNELTSELDIQRHVRTFNAFFNWAQEDFIGRIEYINSCSYRYRKDLAKDLKKFGITPIWAYLEFTRAIQCHKAVRCNNVCLGRWKKESSQ